MTGTGGPVSRPGPYESTGATPRRAGAVPPESVMNATLSPATATGRQVPAGRPEPFAAARPGAGASGSNAAAATGPPRTTAPARGSGVMYVTDRLRHFSLD